MKYLFGITLVLFACCATAEEETSSIIMAGGCFWCIESDYEKLDGVIEVVSGYAGGQLKDPTYKDVSSGNSGHIEVVKIVYQPSVVQLKTLVDYFWLHVDPTRNDGQFCDRGLQYRPALFYKNETELNIIKASMAYIEKHKPFTQPLKVELIKRSEFYPAEDYHQDYYKKNPIRYHFYRFNCGRDAKIEALWGSFKIK